MIPNEMKNMEGWISRQKRWQQKSDDRKKPKEAQSFSYSLKGDSDNHYEDATNLFLKKVEIMSAPVNILVLVNSKYIRY